MRVLVMATPSTTHFACLVPLAWACRSAGHEVVVAGQPDIVGAARGAGFAAVSVGDEFDVLELIGGSLPPGKRPIELGHGRVQGNAWGAAARTWVLHAKYLVSRYLEFARGWRPDLILSDPLEFSALAVGGVLGVPAVHQRWGVDPLGTPGLVAAQRILARRCARMGLPDGLPAPTLVLDPTPADLQVEGANPAEPMRLVPYNGGGSVPGWALSRSDRRRVLVSFGRITPALNGVPLLRTVARSFAGQSDVEAVFALGREYWDELGEVPDTVRLADQLPIASLLDTCDAVVHHGGAGTGMTAASCGVPQVVLPGMMDAFPYSDRITAYGAGVALDEAATQDDEAAVREAVRRVLDEPSYRQRAGALAAEMSAMPSPAEVVETLEKLAG